MPNAFPKAVDSIRRATRSALSRANTRSGTSTASSLKIYERLTDSQFDNIARIYGEDALLRYIRSMEAERLKNGNNT